MKTIFLFLLTFSAFVFACGDTPDDADFSEYNAKMRGKGDDWSYGFVSQTLYFEGEESDSAEIAAKFPQYANRPIKAYYRDNGDYEKYLDTADVTANNQQRIPLITVPRKVIVIGFPDDEFRDSLVFCDFIITVDRDGTIHKIGNGVKNNLLKLKIEIE